MSKKHKYTMPGTLFINPGPDKLPSDPDLLEICHEFLESGIDWGVSAQTYLDLLALLIKFTEENKDDPAALGKEINTIGLDLVLFYKLIDDLLYLIGQKAGERGSATYDAKLHACRISLLKTQEYTTHSSKSSEETYSYYLSLLPKLVEPDEAIVPLETGNKRSKKKIEDPTSFADIFSEGDWTKYIDALANTDPPLINSKREYIGKQRKHKGVICSWFYHLKNKGIIKNINRAQLVIVLNNEFNDLNLGSNGRSFSDISTTYSNDFEKQLIDLTK